VGKRGAQLTAGIDPSGKTTMAGTYEIESAAMNYLFSNFPFVAFDIQKEVRLRTHQLQQILILLLYI